MNRFSAPRIRVVRLGGRNPFIGAALLLVGAAVALALLVFGMVLLAGLAAVGAIALVARRLLGGRARPVEPAAPLDPSREVFVHPRAQDGRVLPPDGR